MPKACIATTTRIAQARTVTAPAAAIDASPAAACTSRITDAKPAPVQKFAPGSAASKAVR